MKAPSTEEIHQAYAARLAAAQENQLELADAVRDCCRYLPLGESLAVAGGTVQWIDACCTTWGGRTYMREGEHTQPVLLINGRLADEPRFVVTKPDRIDHDLLGDWTGPQDGWYSVAAVRRYEQLCEHHQGEDVHINKPAALRTCVPAELVEVAKALAEVMSRRQFEQHKGLEEQTENLQATAVQLRQQINALLARA